MFQYSIAVNTSSLFTIHYSLSLHRPPLQRINDRLRIIAGVVGDADPCRVERSRGVKPQALPGGGEGLAREAF